MNCNEDFLRRAIQLANASQAGPFGAVIVCEDKIVGEGWNRVTEINDPTAHAEVMAIRDACRKLNTYVLDSCQIYSSCEPCPMCLAAIYWARIPELYYAASKEDAAKAGFDDSLIYHEVRLEMDERSLISRQDLIEEGFEPFKAWIENPDRVEY